MFKFHTNKEKYFHFQYLTSRDYIIPFIKDFVELSQPMKVLEIGCAEAGVLKAFTEIGHQCTGIELQGKRIESAKTLMADEWKQGKIRFINKNIYDLEPAADPELKFDLIILKDVIEHIHDQDRFLIKLKGFLNPGGKVFFGFPPWQMPYGGHQQLFRGKVISALPYIHLLPRFMYKGIMKIMGEDRVKIKNLLEIKDTGISIERFERIVKQSNYTILQKQFFLTNPIYQYKFGVKTYKQNRVISNLPIVRNFFTTAAYYLITLD
jgi:SAM-dependent methyltransferase